MPDFIIDNTALPNAKSDANTVDDPDRQWAAADANWVRDSLDSTRRRIRETTNVKYFGVIGNGVADDTAALQAVITANPGRNILLPQGAYKITSTLFITNRATHLIGAFAARSSAYGTQLQYSGTGPCIQIGTDNGHDWSAADYDGPQDHLFENLWISHVSPDTQLASVGDGQNHYKAGAYGIWDWRGGAITMRNVGIEAFEANFVGIQSDVNQFNYVISAYSKYGLYIGPRSDQQVIRDLYSYYCDRAVTIDRAGGTQILSGRLVFCGHSTASPIEIRQGSHGVVVNGTWLENSGAGYAGTDGLSMISAGEVAGYGSGGSIAAPGGSPTTTAVQGLSVLNCHCYNLLSGVAGHKRYLVSAYKCTQLAIQHPTEYTGSALTNFDALLGVQASFSPSATDLTALVFDVPDTLAQSKVWANLGGGAPKIRVQAWGLFSTATLGYDVSATHTINGAVAHNAPASVNGWIVTNSQTGQTVGTASFMARQNGTFDTTSGAQFPVAGLFQNTATRATGSNTLRNIAGQFQASGGQQNWAINTTSGDNQFNTSSGISVFNQAIMGAGTAGAAPSVGTHLRGEIVLNADPVASGFIGWVCVSAGTPGTWKSFGVISA